MNQTITADNHKLYVDYESDPESPRNWDNLGKMMIKPNRRIKGINEIGVSTNPYYETKDFIRDLKEDYKAVVILGIWINEHGSVNYSAGEVDETDNPDGFIIATKEDILDNFTGYDHHTGERMPKKQRISKKMLMKTKNILTAEIETYNQWANGEVYSYSLRNDNGDHVDSCGGFYSVKDMAEYIPDELPKLKALVYGEIFD